MLALCFSGRARAPFSCRWPFTSWSGSRAAIWSGARPMAKAAHDAQMAQLQDELAGLREERARWERRVSAMRSESVDRDLLDEEARAVLDRVGKDDVVIFTDDAKASQK